MSNADVVRNNVWTGTPTVARALIGADHDVKIGRVDLAHVERYECENACEGLIDG